MDELRALESFSRRKRLAIRSLYCCSLGLLGCQYNLDSLYGYSATDGGPDIADAAVLRSDHLISRWIGHLPSVDQDCISCAEAQCANEDSLCKADATCAAYTECVGKDPTPAGQANCRAAHASWLGEDASVRERDLAGPYGQCVFRYKCSTECAGDADLSCLGGYNWPLTAETTVPLHLYLVDAFDQTIPLADIKVRVCNAADIRCAEGESLDDGVTDARGLVELDLPASFSRAFTGYLEVTGRDLYPTLLKFSWNPSRETTQLVGIVRAALFKQAINAIALTPDDTRGMLQLRMLGCQNIGVSGASFTADTADAQTRTWYIINGFPTLGATATDAVGSGGIIDVPEGSSTITATRATDGVTIARAVVPVRAKFMSVVIFSPLAAQ